MNDGNIELLLTATPKRRGRPPGSIKKPKPTQGLVTLSWAATIANHIQKSQWTSKNVGFSTELILQRVDQHTANYTHKIPLAQRIADLTGMSPALAEKVVQGNTPLTVKMVVALAKKLGFTTDYLINGERPSLPASHTYNDCDEDEKKLLDLYRAGTPSYKACMIFIFGLEQLLYTISNEARARLIASLIRLYDNGAHDVLSHLPYVLGCFHVRTGIDPADYIDAPTIFTPVHDWMGIFGPEKMPLIRYMAEV